MSRAERVMGIARWILLGAITAIAATSVYTYGIEPTRTHPDHRADRYYCPMHPQVRSPDPGECPICHMRLVPIPSGLSTTTTAHVPDAGPTAAFAPPPAGLATVAVSLDRQQLIGVATAPVERKALAPELRASAYVEPREGSTVEVRVRVPSYVERLAVRETGVRVGRGQALAWVFSPDVARARDELRVANAWQAVDAGVATVGSDEVGAAGRRNLARLGIATGDVEATLGGDADVPTIPIRAPRGGVVTRMNASIGTYAGPETVLYEITDLARVWVVASVPERSLGSIRIGSTARFVADGHSEEITGKVVRIEPLADATARAARVRVEVRNPGLALRPAQIGIATFAAPPSESLVIPREAVVDTGSARYVFVDHDGTFEPRSVELGVEVGEEVAVTRGLAAGELVVARGGFLLDSESRLAASLGRVPRAHEHP